VSRWVRGRAMRRARLASVPLHTVPERVDCSDDDLSPSIDLTLLIARCFGQHPSKNRVDFGCFPRTSVKSASSGDCHRENALAPEVARINQFMLAPRSRSTPAASGELLCAAVSQSGSGAKR
jgi:hypothetical protein